MIENAEKFDQHMGKSVVAGLLDIDASVYLKPKNHGFEADKKYERCAVAEHPRASMHFLTNPWDARLQARHDVHEGMGKVRLDCGTRRRRNA